MDICMLSSLDHGHVWDTIDEPRELSLMELWTAMDMLGLPLMGHLGSVINVTVDMFGIPLMNMDMDIDGSSLMELWIQH